MARPARFSTGQLIDTAVALAARGGPSALTMAAVARAAGAPSGSLYHRFPGRPNLLAAVWLHALEGFQEGCVRTLRTGPPHTAAVETARHVVAWSRRNPDPARLLLHRPADFGLADWPEADRARLRAGNALVADLLTSVAAGLRESGEPAERALERVRLAVVDLPLSLVRRHLTGETGLPDGAEELAAESARRLLAPAPPSAIGDTR